MRILITNDDGINAIGINVLAEIFSKDNDVIVVAPTFERSACSHSISIHNEINYSVTKADGYQAYSCSGTPCDCIKLGVLHLLDKKPDLIISGINNGSNLGSDIMYSGTVSAALEGTYLGIRSIAISMTRHECEKEKYIEAANYLHTYYKELIRLKLPEFTILNINYPVNQYVGSKFTKAGINLYNDEFVVNQENKQSVKLTGNPIAHNKNHIDCDVEWAKIGYATISPIKLDCNDYDTLKLFANERLFK